MSFDEKRGRFIYLYTLVQRSQKEQDSTAVMLSAMVDDGSRSAEIDVCFHDRETATAEWNPDLLVRFRWNNARKSCERTD